MPTSRIVSSAKILFLVMLLSRVKKLDEDKKLKIEL